MPRCSWFALFALGCSEYGVTGKEEVDPDPVPDDTDLAVDTDDDSGDTIDTVDTGDPPPPTCESFVPPDAPGAEIDVACMREPVPGTLDPVVEWTTEGTITYAADPDHEHPYVMPAVANLTDDDGDGDVDEDDVPDIAYTVYSMASSGLDGTGYLRVVSGDGSREILSVGAFRWDGGEYQVSKFGGVAIGDLEGDGVPEIVTISNAGNVVAFDNVGTPKWVYTATPTSVYSYPSLADLDGDGLVEVIVGEIVLNSYGDELFVGAYGKSRPDSNPTVWGSIAVPVDVDGDGILEIAAGNTLYDIDGTALAQTGLPDGFCAVGDIDLDGLPEIVTTVHSTGGVYVWDPDGTVLWSITTGAGGGGPPTVADFDGDGAPEIGVAGRTHYSVVEGDGTVLWQSVIQDYSSSATGSSVFDFDADGSAEVVFADELALYILDGATGSVRWQADDHVHGTAWEYPVVVDVDHDDQAEIVLGSTNNGGSSGWNGITVIGDAGGSWAPARAIWNQHAYHITNVNSDGSIPAVQAANWLTWNNFRAGGTELGPSHWLADLAPADPSVCTETCALDVVSLWLGVANTGLLAASSFDVAFYRDSDTVPVLTETVSGLDSGTGTVIGPVRITRVEWGAGPLLAVIDDGGAIDECDENDNSATLDVWPCP